MTTSARMASSAAATARSTTTSRALRKVTMTSGKTA
jgi:hypothetical protein